MRATANRWATAIGVGMIGLGLAAAGVVAGGVGAGWWSESDQRSPVHRERRPPADGREAADRDQRSGPAVYPHEFRTIDGHGNNQANPAWGAVGVPLLRRVPVAYADGVGAPSGATRPGARAISNAVCAQTADLPNRKGASSYLWQWGQFLDHDIDETPITNPGEAFDIPVPAGDAWFDPEGHGTATVPLDRSAWVMVDGVRQQVNNITAYIDASNVYGSEQHRADWLRTNDGTGRLKVSPGDLMPFNTDALDNAPTAHDPSFFLAGDIRANEQVGLLAMHTLFVREHNWHADRIRAASPGMPGDEVYERARAIVAAEMQAITYREFLPLLLGPGAIPPYSGYNASVNPGVANVFATAAYRVGHTMLTAFLPRLNPANHTIPGGDLALRDAFFAPAELIATNIDPILRGLAQQKSQNIDRHVIDDVRNFLFGAPGAGGFDLPALNLQRGRDHGLPTYNDVRAAYGVGPALGFDDPLLDPEAADALDDVYASIDDVDPWVGMLCETHRPGALVGETLFRVLRDQFLRLRDGDRFWYESYLPPDLVQMVESTRLSDVIRRNTTIGAELQMEVFLTMEPDPDACECDMNADGRTDVHDFAAFATFFGGPASGPGEGDFDGNGVVDVTDFAALIADFGCEWTP